MKKELKIDLETKIEEVKLIMIQRAKDEKFEGNKEELFDVGMYSKELSYWSWEERENHSFDLGKITAYEEILKLIC